MLSNIVSFVLGTFGIIIGFCLAKPIANALTGLTYGLLYIPVLLLGCAIFGAIGFSIGRL